MSKIFIEIRKIINGYNYIILRIFLQNSRFLCGTSSVSMELFQFTSTWLIVALTWTRVIAIMFPFGARNCQNCSAVIIITTLICISFIISLTKLYSGGKVYSHNRIIFLLFAIQLLLLLLCYYFYRRIINYRIRDRQRIRICTMSRKNKTMG